jgi:hypothetical protein
LKAAAISLALLLPLHAHAWGEIGHETIGEIAALILSQDPATLKNLSLILGSESLPYSSAWPDTVREDERYKKFAPFHFLKPDGTLGLTTRSARTVLDRYPNIIRDPKLSKMEKLIALRYLIHVVGDIHQPLHVSSNADYGANSCAVKIQLGPQPLEVISNLHRVWDRELILFSMKQAQAPEYKKYASALLAKYPDLAKVPAQIDTQAWIEEAAAFVRTDVYPDQLPQSQRDYCKRDKQPSSALPTLGTDYFQKKSLIVEKQLVLAAAHVAAELKTAVQGVEKQPIDGDPGATETSVLEDLLRE